jgi:hypothetical protein
MEIFHDLGNRPLVVLRFNPDSYKKDGKKVSGCFKVTKTYSLSINKNEWSDRIKLLIETIKKYLDRIPEKEVTIEYLYYDDSSN